MDYQGQQQNVDRTVTSTVPTLLQRDGIFTEAIGTRVPAIFDPATTVPDGKDGLVRTPFSGGRIPLDRMDPVAVALIRRLATRTAFSGRRALAQSPLRAIRESFSWR